MCGHTSTVGPPGSVGTQDSGAALKKVSRPLSEPIAGSGLGEDVARPGRIRLELPPELRDVHVQIVRLLAVAPPPNLAQERRVCEQLAGVAGEDAEERELVRCELDGLAADEDGPLLEVYAQVSELDDRLGGGVHPAQSRTQPREELVHAERLGDVVVRAGGGRRDLLGLVTDDREDDHRRAAPRTKLAGDLGAAAVRKDEVEHDGVGGIARQRGQGSLCRLGGVDVVAGPAEARPQRAQNLRLVVHDKDARTHARTAADRVASGSERTRWPPAGSSCAQSRPPFASAKPRAIASPRPAPRPAAVPRLNGWKSASRFSAGRPGPLSITCRRSSVEPCSARTRTPDRLGE